MSDYNEKAHATMRDLFRRPFCYIMLLIAPATLLNNAAGSCHDDAVAFRTSGGDPRHVVAFTRVSTLLNASIDTHSGLSPFCNHVLLSPSPQIVLHRLEHFGLNLFPVPQFLLATPVLPPEIPISIV